MTLRASLARYLSGLLEEISPPTSSRPPPPNLESTPLTTTKTTTTPGISEAGTLAVVLETMRAMQEQNLREIRGMVTDILQGRPMTEVEAQAAVRQVDPQPSRTPFDPPDYDNPGIEDLPGSLQSVFEREAGEQDAIRLLRTEREVLSHQLDLARAALVDPQGPASGLFLSTD